MRLTLNQICEYTGGTFSVVPLDANTAADGITWDSRQVVAGCVYVALPGERFDGHDFATRALQSGAVCIVAMQKLDVKVHILASEFGAGVIQVPDTARAFEDLARAWRKHLKGRVIALTGSTGKTTTKNLVREVLSSSFSVVATQGNQNNELGVPNTILSAHEDTDVVIVEMGMRGLGQIAQLCKIAQPHWGLVTNVGESHIELLGSRENIAQAKGELLEAVFLASGLGFVNAADNMTDCLVQSACGDKKSPDLVYFAGSQYCFGGEKKLEELSSPAVWAKDVVLDEQGCAHFTLCARSLKEGSDQNHQDFFVDQCPCNLSLKGLHNVSNACSAAAVGYLLGIPLKTIAGAVERCLPEGGRQETLRAQCGALVINDAYNANPDSMSASLQTFAALEVKGCHIAVLGDMGELGDFAFDCHKRVGILVSDLSLDRLICVGNLARTIADEAQKAGMDSCRVMCVSQVSEALEELRSHVGPDDAVLVKASHFMGLERIVEGLVK